MIDLTSHSFLRDEREGILPDYRFEIRPEDYEPDEPEGATAVQGMQVPTLVVEDDSDQQEDQVPVETLGPTTTNLLEHPEAHPLVLELLLLRKYGPEWMLWDPEVVELRLRADFKVQDVPDLTMDKLMAVRTAHLVDSPWREWEVFSAVGQAFNDTPVNFTVMWLPSPAEICGTVQILNQIRDDVSWTDREAEDLRAFMSTAFLHGNMLAPVPPCGFLSIDTKGLVVDGSQVARQLPAVLKSRRAPTEDSALAEQLRHALAIQEYCDDLRKRYDAQKELLNDVHPK